MWSVCSTGIYFCRYQSCWPVFQLDVDGVIFVYNPEAKEQLPEFELLYDYFVVQSGLRDFKCLIFVNLRSEVDESSIILRKYNRGYAKEGVLSSGRERGREGETQDKIQCHDPSPFSSYHSKRSILYLFL